MYKYIYILILVTVRKSLFSDSFIIKMNSWLDCPFAEVLNLSDSQQLAIAVNWY